MSVLDTKVHVTKGQFIKLVGALAYDQLMHFLETTVSGIGAKAPTQMQLVCRAYLRVLNSETGLDLDNPEILAPGAALDMLVAAGAVSVATAQVIRDFVASCEAV